MSEWNDLRKQKPNDGEYVLCYQPRFKKIKQCVISTGTYHKSKDVISPFLSADRFDDVRWWMPLPSLPNGKRATK